jgi:hypothetical protein
MRRAVPLLAGLLIAVGVTAGDTQTSPNGIAVIRGYEDSTGA